MKEQNVSLGDFKFEVIDKGSAGFLYLFGAKPAKIKIFLPDTADAIIFFVENILKKTRASVSQIEIEHKNNVYNVTITGAEDPGFLIGKEARLLDSIEYLTNQMINKKEKRQVAVKIDVDNYRKRRETAFFEKLKSIADRVSKRGNSVTLEPLPKEKRKIVYRFIEKDNNLKTMTIGNGELKKVVIFSAAKGMPRNMPKNGKRNQGYRSRKS